MLLPLWLQGDHLDCLQWLVGEGQVPLAVKDADGETLMHHAAFHGQVDRWGRKEGGREEGGTEGGLEEGGTEGGLEEGGRRVGRRKGWREGGRRVGRREEGGGREEGGMEGGSGGGREEGGTERGRAIIVS